jgi:hypothetical protein
MSFEVRFVRDKCAVILDRNYDRALRAMTRDRLGALGSSSLDHLGEPDFCLMDLPGPDTAHLLSLMINKDHLDPAFKQRLTFPGAIVIGVS